MRIRADFIRKKIHYGDTDDDPDDLFWKVSEKTIFARSNLIYTTSSKSLKHSRTRVKHKFKKLSNDLLNVSRSLKFLLSNRFQNDQIEIKHPPLLGKNENVPKDRIS